MRFRVSQELRQPVGTEFTMDLAARSLFLDDNVDLSDLEGHVELLRTDRGLLVRSQALASLGAQCSRCLAPMESPLEISFEEEFVPVVDPVTGRHITAREVEDGFVIDEDLMLDLGESLRQYALMASPSKPLCRPDCAGLCPLCGADLNKAACSCPPQADERWQALAGLKTKDQEGS